MLFSSANQIIVFGSFAAKLSSPLSDLDVVCIGEGTRFKNRFLDLCWVSEEDVCKDEWLGSELAGHVAKYGVWLSGRNDWRDATFTGDAAIERKRRRILSLSRTVSRLWEQLHPIFRTQYNVTIRRELQRLQMLESNISIPPTRLLDEKWCAERSDELLRFRDSFAELHPYSGRSNAPDILRRVS
ncbi:MAG: nucleotidyltransferase domain-containing protein [Candidatus Sulfotelmatobacter sp.]|jgi:hypothetical protein